MAPQRLDIHQFHIVHNTPCLSPKFCITIVSNFPWVQWLGKISKGEQGALWSMWKKWIDSRNMIILLATKQNALSSIWNASVLFQMFFHFLTSFLNPDEVMQERFKIHPLWNYICEAQFNNLLKPHSGTSDQSNQFPSQPVILTNSQSRQLSNHSAGQRVISQFVKQPVKTVIVSLDSQSRELSNHSTGRRVGSRIVIQSVKTVIWSLGWPTSSQSISWWQSVIQSIS